jgi:ribonuclease T2
VRAALGAVLLALTVASAAAQAPRERNGARPGDFDFYVLALSWSPAFCDLSGRNDDEQCAPGNGNGFVLHGLWPQYDSGYPANCAANRFPTRSQIARATPPFPSEGLARYQWRKHGACSGLDPGAYFDLARTVFSSIRQPDMVSAATEDRRLRPTDLERAFVAANPGLRADVMAVQCRRGQLTEVRICIAKTGRGYAPCREVDRDACRSPTITLKAIDAPN